MNWIWRLLRLTRWVHRVFGEERGYTLTTGDTTDPNVEVQAGSAALTDGSTEVGK